MDQSEVQPASDSRLRPSPTRATAITHPTKLTRAIQDDEKLKLINDIAKSLGITESIAVVPAADIMKMIQTIRNCQQQVARIQTNPEWVDPTIERVKNATGRHFGEG